MDHSGSRIRIGVVGVGHLGRSHARLLAANQEVELAAVADVEPKALAAVSAAHDVPGFADYRDLVGKVDAVSIVVPTRLHAEVASHFLAREVDVFVEKPITPTLAEGERLVALAAKHGRVLQVGHVERFNAVLAAIAAKGLRPRYIESQRVAPFTFRSTDIGVVLDLMIHDLDLVLWWMGGTVKSVDAFGGSVFTPAEDMASAILKFDHGGVAHLTASRVAMKAARKMRLFAADGYASLDFQQAQGVLIRKQPGWEFGALDLGSIEKGQDLWKLVYEGLLQVEQYKLDSGNPLDAELRSFLAAVRERSRPVVSGEDACAAVAIAERVLAAMRDCRW